MKNDIKNRIIETAKEKFLKNGYKNTRTDDLAKDIGISKRTLYEHFSSKKLILQTIIKKEFEKHIKQIDSIVEILETDENANFFDEIKKLWEIHSKDTYKWNDRLYIEIQTYHPDLWETIAKFDKEENKGHFLKIFKAGQKLGAIKKNIDLDLVYLIEVTFMRHILTPSKAASLPYSIRDLVAKLHNILFTGIFTKSAMKEFKEKFKNDENQTEANY